MSPPASVCDAAVAVAPILSAQVLDAHVEGEGWFRATLLSAVPVASAGPDQAMTEAALQRYLAEASCFPTALLARAGISWEDIDDVRARATIDDGGVTANVIVRIDEAGHVDRVTADRYRQETSE